jgi:hypothetical protein
MLFLYGTSCNVSIIQTQLPVELVKPNRADMIGVPVCYMSAQVWTSPGKLHVPL